MTNEINLYSKEQTDALLAEKEDVGTAYTKAETDALLDGKEDTGVSYTKAQTDALLAGKEDAGVSYTKAQVDGLLADKASYGEVVELGGSSDIGSDLRPIKIVGGVAVAVANPLIDTETAQTINAQKTFATNPKAAAPASGAVDTSVVNANWVSQTGDSSPNNLVHRTGLETIPGEKIISNLWGNPITNPNGVWNALIKLTVSTRDIEINLLISDRYGCALIHFAFNHTTHEYTRRYYVSAGTVNAAIGITEIEGAYYICAKTTVNSYVNIMPLSCMSGAYHLVTLPVQIALGSSATIYDADIWNVST